MSRITTVITPAASLDITTIERAKRQLSIKESLTDHDEFIAQLITQCSGRADRYCDRVFIRQEYQDEFDQRGGVLQLANPPVEDVVVTQGGATLVEGGAYAVNKRSGLVRLINWHSASASCFDVMFVVTYKGGYLAPPAIAVGSLMRDAAEVEDAVIRLVLAGFKAKGRDPLLKAQDNPAPLGRQEWWVGATAMAGGMPEDIAAMLDPFALGLASVG